MAKSEITKVDFSDPVPEEQMDKIMWHILSAIGILMDHAGLEAVVLDSRDINKIDYMTLQNVEDFKMRFTCKMKDRGFSAQTDRRSLILVPEDE